MHFDNDFIWGAASASYQMEGGASDDGKGPSIWDTFSHIPGKIIDGTNGDTTCDGYHRFEEDLDILQKLGIKNYRFSISWPRVLPDGSGEVNKAGLAYYDKVVDGCLSRGIEPWVTLYHWDLPQALEDRGGWQNRETAVLFGEYCRIIAEHFRGRVTHYMTVNEPETYIGLGYCVGEHAPGLRLDYEGQFRAWHNMLLSHGYGALAIREADPDAQVAAVPCGNIGYIHEHTAKTPEGLADYTFHSHPDDTGVPRSFFTYHWFLDPAVFGRYPDDPESPWGGPADEFARSPEYEHDMAIIKQPLDFIGINIYSGIELDPENGYKEKPFYPGFPRTAFKWPVTPEVVYWGPRLMYERYGLPIYLTENGLSCNDKVYLDGKVHDPDRIDFLTRYLSELSDAVADGVPVKGYFHWSLTDNFEWANGYTERFGLVYIDYRTGERIPKDSAYWYADLIKRQK